MIAFGTKKGFKIDDYETRSEVLLGYLLGYDCRICFPYLVIRSMFAVFWCYRVMIL